MAVGTQGAVKGLTPEQIQAHHGQVMLVNAFHLAGRPGEATVRGLGGLHAFTGWNRPILADSGGYQIFSLPGLRKVTDEGATFANPLDGNVRMFSPEAVVDIQCTLGPDMAMVLDECPPYPCEPAHLTRAVDRSIRWAERSVAHLKNGGGPSGRDDGNRPNFLGIIQGGMDDKERQRSLDATAALPFAGFALGGFCVGEPIEETHRAVANIAPKLPADKVRYLMGMGRPEDILFAVGQGVDMFDCTLPTRNGRNGTAFTSRGILHIKNARFARCDQPLDEDCGCYTCRTYPRALLRHLLLARHMNAGILISLHNLAFYLSLMEKIRRAIEEQRFEQFRGECLARWQPAGKPDDETKA
jgi:queuine tRNA-ribosyltransferase